MASRRAAWHHHGDRPVTATTQHDDSFGTLRERLVAEHVLRELAAGRNLDDVLDDAYVRERASPAQVRSLLDHPEISRAVGAATRDAIAALIASGTR
jgi:hypothetical protein